MEFNVFVLHEFLYHWLFVGNLTKVYFRTEM
jgi:hypothetical protein